MTEATNVLREGAAALGINLNDEHMRAFGIYLGGVKEWNRRANLTGLTEDKEIVTKHFLDSLSCLASGKLEGHKRMVDIGTGAGLPGIPLKIVEPGMEITLLDSSRKKAEFLSFIVEELGLSRVRVVCSRVEDFARREDTKESFDVALARAVSPLAVLMEYALPLLRIEGWFVAQKSKRLEKELAAARTAASLLGGEIEEVKEVEVPFLEATRYLVLTRKTRPTPPEYPRRPGIPTKRPLGR
ncbi:MAG: 16S rRNA (guanine(527)-N(7))-methyltransferase RsmG [Actinomycetota bacterium]|nr:16S rRNA (guanine(527)-N(7))-methyltransferase RsmG [Actinomycetota bacterium]